MRRHFFNQILLGLGSAIHKARWAERDVVLVSFGEPLMDSHQLSGETDSVDLVLYNRLDGNRRFRIIRDCPPSGRYRFYCSDEGPGKDAHPSTRHTKPTLPARCSGTTYWRN